MGLGNDQATLVYAQCLASLEYVRDTFGMGEVRRMLRLMPAFDFSIILQNEIRQAYPDFEQAVSTYVAQKYGS